MKNFVGKVISNKMQKTAVVEVERWVKHPIYQKRYRRHKKYHVGDNLGVKVGDLVKIVQVRPISKTKKWKILEVIKK